MACLQRAIKYKNFQQNAGGELCTYQWFAPGWGGGDNPRGIGNLLKSRVEFPTPGHLENVKFHICPLKFLTQQTILDVKIPTLGELHDVKFLWVARPPTPPPPPPSSGKPLIGALTQHNLALLLQQFLKLGDIRYKVIIRWFQKFNKNLSRCNFFQKKPRVLTKKFPGLHQINYCLKIEKVMTQRLTRRTAPRNNYRATLNWATSKNTCQILLPET